MSKPAPGKYIDKKVKLRDLVVAQNIRHKVDREQIDAMKASILAKGVLQNLIAAPRRSDGAHAIFAGHTRFIAASELVDEGRLSPDYEVNVRIYLEIDPESPDAIAIAMTENMVRSQMDYIDECAAMARLAEARKTEEEIAAIFGYRPKTVVERLLIAKLIPEAHALVRSTTRNLAWARALTIADATMQKQICDDIATNPGSWATGEDIRKHLLQSTIPARHALFDIEDYKGDIVRDMFEGDQLSDIKAFWALQNEAVTDLAKEIEAEGFREVIVTREPFQSWRFEDSDNPSESLAFVEVMPNGKVSVIRGVVPIAEEQEKIGAIDAADLESSNHIEEIADHEVRATPSICDYAAAHRSAMVQAHVSGNFRAAMEYTVIAMLGHRNASFSAQAYSMPGDSASHISRAFAHMAQVAENIEESSGVEVPSPELRDREIAAMVRAMKDAQLQALFTQLVSQRLGQQKRRGADDRETSLMNVFGSDIDIRSWWVPDETFFGLMATEDLRRLATRLLPGASATRFASSRKKDLVRTLANNFRDAADGVMGDGEVARMLNDWTPGVMSFPARIEMKSNSDEIFDAEEDADIDALLFEA